MIKIRNGTANESEASKCLSCRNATVIRGRSASERFISCGIIGARESARSLPRHVTECSEHDPKDTPSLLDMRAIAWTLETDKSRGKIGFAPPKKNQVPGLDF